MSPWRRWNHGVINGRSAQRTHRRGRGEASGQWSCHGTGQLLQSRMPANAATAGEAPQLRDPGGRAPRRGGRPQRPSIRQEAAWLRLISHESFVTAEVQKASVFAVSDSIATPMPRRRTARHRASNPGILKEFRNFHPEGFFCRRLILRQSVREPAHEGVTGAVYAVSEIRTFPPLRRENSKNGCGSQ